MTEGLKTANNQWLTLQQMGARSAAWKAKADRLRLDLFNIRKKLAGLLKNLAAEKRITLLLSQENIPGVRRVLAQALKHGDSSQAIVTKLERAMSGIYHARGWTEDEKDTALLVLRIGGPALLAVMQKTTGLPGVSFTRKFAGKVLFF